MNTIAGSENVVVRTYRTEHDMQRGIKSMAKGGWNVLLVEQRATRKGGLFVVRIKVLY